MTIPELRPMPWPPAPDNMRLAYGQPSVVHDNTPMTHRDIIELLHRPVYEVRPYNSLLDAWEHGRIPPEYGEAVARRIKGEGDWRTALPELDQPPPEPSDYRNWHAMPPPGRPDSGPWHYLDSTRRPGAVAPPKDEAVGSASVMATALAAAREFVAEQADVDGIVANPPFATAPDDDN